MSPVSVQEPEGKPEDSRAGLKKWLRSLRKINRFAFVLIGLAAVIAASVWIRPAHITSGSHGSPGHGRSVSGRVLDPSGAIITDAKVTVIPSLSGIHAGAGVVETTRTSAGGEFHFENMASQTFDLILSAPGFQTKVLNDVPAGQSLDSVILRVGSASQTVEVAVNVHDLPDPVYKAVFSLRYNDNPNHLYDEMKTTVRFSIGPPARENGISTQTRAVNRAILKSKARLHLYVVMNCTVCSGDAVQTQAITYVPAGRRSTEAAFTIVPRRSLAQRSGAGQIVFVVRSHDQGDHDLDRAIADVIVGTEQGGTSVQGTSAHSPSQTSNLTQDGTLSTLTPGDAPPGLSNPPLLGVPNGPGDDLTVIVSRGTSGVTVQLQPGNPELVRLIAGKVQEGGLPKVFSASIDEARLQTMAFRVYAQLKTITDQHDEALHNSASGNLAKLTSAGTASVIGFSDSDYLLLISQLRDAGTAMYRMLFVDGVNPNLRDAMVLLKNFNRADGKPVRIRILTNHLYYPWQLLHPPADQSEKSFWGFKYILSVDSLDRRNSGRLPGMLELDTDSNQIFVAVQNKAHGDSDDVAALALAERDSYSSRFGSNHLSQSSADLLNMLKESGDSVKAIVAFTHGTSGVVFQQAAGGSVISNTDIRGPRLLFALTGNDYVTPDMLESLANDVPESRTEYFTENPFVMLNACETASGGMAPLGGPSFPDALLHMGARGVIGTEAPVWALFAYHFGTDLFQSMSVGRSAPEALLETRVRCLEAKNPLGLLYSYYGGSEVSVVRRDK